MKKVSQLTDFYYKTLYPTLQELEKQRVALRYRILIVGGLYTLFFLVLFFTLFNNHVDIDMIAFIAFGYIAGGAIIYKWLIKDYTKEFKEKIIAPLIKEIDANLNYSANLHIPQEHFNRSYLFTSHPDRVSGNDYVRGKIDGINIEFSDFHAEKKHKDSKGRTSWSTIFQGLFIVSEFNKNLHSKTVVLPDSAQSAFGDFIGGWLQSNNFGRDNLVKMDNVDFEKEFVVYSNDQVESRYILTHTMMQRLLNYQKKTQQKLFVSFINNKIYIAIAYNKDLFEPSIFRSLLKYKIAIEYVQTLHLAIGIIEELKLNQKLWSKV